MTCHPLRRVPWIALFLSVGASCHKLDDDDCRSWSTCPGQLLAEYEAKLGRNCADCLRKSCFEDLRACEKDADCQQAARCQLQDSPSGYQACLSGLYAKDASSIDDETGAFEGKLGGFGRCLDTQQCSTYCKQPVWTCEDSESACAITGPVDLVVSVQYYGIVIEKADGVQVSLCGDPTDCPGLGTTVGGLVRKEFPRTDGGSYFRLEAPSDALHPFPTTLFFPGCVDTGGPQPVPLYVVSDRDVGLANEILADRYEVFSEVGQSIVLPMSCHSAPGHDLTARGVTIGVRGHPLPLCKNEKQLPCIWYGDSSFGLPDLGAEDTSGGKTAGIAGLEPGWYDLVACHEGKLVAERRVLMEGGKLTIARMLPFTAQPADDSLCTDLVSSSPSPR